MMQPTATLPINGVQFSTATDRIIFGVPAADALVEEVEALGCRRVLITTSRSMSGPNCLPARLGEALGDRFAGVFSDIPPHAPRTAVLAGANLAREVNADLLVSVGGGSVSDTTKHILHCLWEDITDNDGLNRHLPAIFKEVDPSRNRTNPDGRIRMLAVPTMLSAGEFTWFAGITDEQRGIKEVAFHPLFSPSSIILDPAATEEVPVHLLQSSGMKAVEHAVGFLCESNSIPLIEVLATQAWNLLYNGLPKLGGPDDSPQVRLDLLMGAWYSLYGTQYGLHAGASHAIGHVLGALGVSHGDTGSVVIPGILEWNADHNSNRQEAAAAAVAQAGRPLPEILREFGASLGRPTRLREVGIGRDRFQEIAEKALDDPLIVYNARTIGSSDDVREILELAW